MSEENTDKKIYTVTVDGVSTEYTDAKKASDAYNAAKKKTTNCAMCIGKPKTTYYKKPVSPDPSGESGSGDKK